MLLIVKRDSYNMNPDCWQYTFGNFLSYSELCIALQVCKEWNALCKDNIVWKRLHDAFLADYGSFGTPNYFSECKRIKYIEYKKTEVHWVEKKQYFIDIHAISPIRITVY